jgi:DNA-binding IclR family transcriptional regulator
VLEKRTPHTVVDPAVLEAVWKQVPEDGYAIEENETDLGVMCIGAPVFDADGVVAAVSITVPTVRAIPDRRRRLIAAVRKAAEQISKSLRENR